MERVMAHFLLRTKTPQEQAVFDILNTLDPPVRPLNVLTTPPSTRFALFVRPGRYERLGRSKVVRRKTLVRVSTNPAAFYENGTCTLPHWAYGAQGYVGITELNDYELSDPKTWGRLTDALRESLRLAHRIARINAVRQREDAKRNTILLLGAV